MDEDRLRELQNAIQEQLWQRDEERERNITKRVQEFEKTFDFVNSHLLQRQILDSLWERLSPQIKWS